MGYFSGIKGCGYSKVYLLMVTIKGIVLYTNTLTQVLAEHKSQ